MDIASSHAMGTWGPDLIGLSGLIIQYCFMATQSSSEWFLTLHMACPTNHLTQQLQPPPHSADELFMMASVKLTGFLKHLLSVCTLMFVSRG